MNNASALLPFTEEASDPLFVAILEHLRLAGSGLNDGDLHHIYLECRGNIVHAAELFGQFWTKFTDGDDIDVRDPARCLYNMLYARIRLPIAGMSTETAQKNCRLLAAKENADVAMATNAFLNAMISELRRPDMALAYAKD